MTTFALVHGAWRGTWCWQLLSPILLQVGHDVWRRTCRVIGDDGSMPTLTWFALPLTGGMTMSWSWVTGWANLLRRWLRLGDQFGTC